MRHLRKLLYFFILLLAFHSAYSQVDEVEVDVNLDVLHTLPAVTNLGEVTAFDRSKFVTIHADITEAEWDGDNELPDLRDDFLNGYDVYLGRETGDISNAIQAGLAEDPARPGYADPTQVEISGLSYRNTYAGQTQYHQYDHRNVQVLCPQLEKFYPGLHWATRGWMLSETDTDAEPFGTAAGEFYGRYVSNAYGTGGTTGKRKPTYVEVINEPVFPMVDAWEYVEGPGGHDLEGPEPLDKIFKFHRTVAQEIKKYDTDVEVAGFVTAFPEFEKNNFNQWNERWKTFIDMTGNDLDAWSLHIYDFASIHQGKQQFRKGSNIEATLDMIDQYSIMTLGELKPYVISEFGAQMHDQLHHPWSPYRDWLHLKSVNTLMLQFMERANTVGRIINFLPIKAEWYTNVWWKYNHRLMRRNDEPAYASSGPWVYTDMVKTFQLWKDVDGARVESSSNNPDVMVDAYVDGSTVYIIINNLDFAEKEVNLNLLGSGLTPQSVELRNMYLYGTAFTGVPALDINTVTEIPETVTVGSEGCAILVCNYSSPIAQSANVSETKYFSDKYLQEITANSPVVFNINGVSLGSNGEAVLRVGVGRDHFLSLKPEVKVNGTEIETPDNFRGDWQREKERYFGALEIPVPYELLQANNQVSVEFPDNSGHISTVTLQVFNADRAITRTWENTISGVEIADASIITGVGQERKLSASVLPEGAANNIVIWSTSAPGTATVSQDGIVTGVVAGSATITATSLDGLFSDNCQVTVQAGQVSVPVEAISIESSLNYVAVGNTLQLNTSILPLDATNTIVDWSSSNPGVASVSTNGDVLGVTEGEVIITAISDDGNFTATKKIEVENVTAAYVEYMDTSFLALNEFPVGDSMPVRVKFNAGTGNVVAQNCIKHYIRWIREVDGQWNAVWDFYYDDESIYGEHSGISIFNVPTDIIGTPSADLPDNEFYFLYSILYSSDGTTADVGRIVKFGENQVAVTGVEVAPASWAMRPGETKELEATVLPEGAFNRIINWTSSAPGVATVDPTSGLVTAVGTGNATITATTDDGGYTDICSISVVNQITITDIAISPSPVNVAAGNTLQLSTVITPENAVDQTLSWSSSNTAVATVSDYGLVTAHIDGTATIMATANDGGGATETVTVNVADIPVESITVDPVSGLMYIGNELTLTETVLPEGATNKAVSWSSSDESVATVVNGVVTAEGIGEATITVTADDNTNGTLSAAALITVAVVPTVITIEAEDLTETGGTFADGNNNDINVNGTTVNYVNNGDWATYDLTIPEDGLYKVTYYISCPSDDGNITTLVDGEQITSDAIPNNGLGANGWESYIPIVSADTAPIYAGSYTFRIEASGSNWQWNLDKIELVRVGVISGEVTHADSVSLDITTTTLTIGSSVVLTETVWPVDADNKSVTWSSSDTDIVTVADGVVTAVGGADFCTGESGTATVTVKTVDGGFTATSVVSVISEGVSVTGIAVDPTSETIKVGERLTLQETISPPNATCNSVTWSSDDPTVATVVDGEVQGQQVGSATITVTSQDGLYSASATITVEAIDNPVTGVTLDSDAESILIGGTVTLTETIEPDNADVKTVTWNSSRTDVATVTNGVVTGVGEGTTIITVRTDDGGFTANATITVDRIAVTGVALNSSTATLEFGEEITLLETVSPNNATNKSVTWNSSDTDVATVIDGEVTAVGYGTAVITVTTDDGGYTANTTINVPSIDVSGVILNIYSATLEVGEQITLLETVLPADATDKSVTWSSNNTDVATVANGVVTAIGQGSATITVRTTNGGFVANANVRINHTINVTDVALSSSERTLYVDEVFTLIETIIPGNATNKNVSWNSDNDSVATVTNGVVRAIAPGNAVIEVVTEDGDLSAACSVQVKQRISIALSSISETISEGDTLVLSANIAPADASVNWSSSDNNIATVSSTGVVIGLTEGEVIITVASEDGESSAQCLVTIEKDLTNTIGTSISELSLYPNPVDSELNLDLPESYIGADVQIINLLGKAIISEKVANMHHVINVSDLSSGVYLIQVSKGDEVIIERFIKE